MFSSLYFPLACVGAAVLANEILKRTPLVRLEVRAGRTILGGLIFVYFVGAGLSAVMFAVLPLVDAHVAWSTGRDYPLLLGFAGVLLAASLLVGWWWWRTKWTWDEQGISSFQGRSETRLSWGDIRKVDASSWTWKVSDRYGHEVVWWRYTIGHDVLMAALRLRRPDLVELAN